MSCLCHFCSLSALMDAVFPRLRRLLAWVSPLFPKYQPSGQITCTATGNKPTCSKPESAREAPARVEHPFQQACVLRAIRLSARTSDNTMYSTIIKHHPSASSSRHMLRSIRKKSKGSTYALHKNWLLRNPWQSDWTHTVRYAKALCERAQCETLRCQADQKRDVDGLDE